MDTGNCMVKAWGGAGARWKGVKGGMRDIRNNTVNNKKQIGVSASLSLHHAL